MTVKLFDSELKVMEVLWEKECITAKEISAILKESIGWNKNTTYTVIKKCVDKQIIARSEPDFLCHALIKKEEVQKQEVTELVNKMFDGSADLLFASFLDGKNLSKEEIVKLKQLVNDLEE